MYKVISKKRTQKNNDVVETEIVKCAGGVWAGIYSKFKGRQHISTQVLSYDGEPDHDRIRKDVEDV